MENINEKLGKKILSALISQDIVIQEDASNLEGKLVEGKLKDSDWITAFTQKYNSVSIEKNEAK